MEQITGRLDISGIKRMQMPETTILIKCPKCGTVMDIPLVDQLYYPDEGECQVAFECEKCDIEIERKIDIVSVIVTLDIHDAKIV